MDRFAAAGRVTVASDLVGLAGPDAVLRAELGACAIDPAAQADVQPKNRAVWAPMNAPEQAVRIKAGVATVFEQLQPSSEGGGWTAVAGCCFGGTSRLGGNSGVHGAAAHPRFPDDGTRQAAQPTCRRRALQLVPVAGGTVQCLPRRRYGGG